MEKIKNFPKWPKVSEDECIYISDEGLKQIQQKFDPQIPQKNFSWTTDNSIELPIRMKRQGLGNIDPVTIAEQLERIVRENGKKPALSVKIKGKWFTRTYNDYFTESQNFAKALISLGITKRAAINIIGFNAPEWIISFVGSAISNYMPVGVYTTNNPEACQYVAAHSDCELVVVENKIHLAKYLQIWNTLPKLKYAVIYAEGIPADLPEQFKSKVFTYKDFIELGKKFSPRNDEEILARRQREMKPGHCMTLVYTSGTTGPPKGVMLSHDNYIWTARTALLKFGLKSENQVQERIVSYLPLSHSAAQIIDIFGTLCAATHLFFADPSALSGSLVNYLQEIRPTFFFSVPRVWEKIEEKMKAMAAQNGFLKQKIGNWAKSIGVQGTYAEYQKKPTPPGFGIAKKLIFNKIKNALGLDQARWLIFGAAPLSPQIRLYFCSLNLYLVNAYGMSESSAPQTLAEPENFDKFDLETMKSCGISLIGTDMMIFMPDKDGNGEICYKGRNRFMGYFKQEDETKKTIDEFGYLHSGDVGRLDPRGNLYITGRIKELLITAGGENVAPVLIENVIIEELKFLSNVMVVGDAKPFLSVLLTLKHKQGPDGKFTKELTPETLQFLKSIGSNAKNTEEARKCQKLNEIISKGIATSNQKAISQAQKIVKWYILDGDFSIDGDELTPTMKLKRNVVAKKHSNIIESLYEGKSGGPAPPKAKL